MRVKVRQYLKRLSFAFCRGQDPEIQELRHDIEALDQYLRIQRLRRVEEARFIRLQSHHLKSFPLFILGMGFLIPFDASAGSFEGSLQSLVGAVVGRILPIISLGYVAKNALSHVQNDPEAGRESVRVAIGVVMLLGVNNLFAWLQSHVR